VYRAGIAFSLLFSFSTFELQHTGVGPGACVCRKS
jgi:hypothetical protein